MRQRSRVQSGGRQPWRARVVRPACALALVACGCIIPDREIGFEGGPANPGAVRIVERGPLLAEMDEFCHLEEGSDPAFCPQVRASMPSGLIRSADNGPFCICPGGRDERAIGPFSIYAEDPDLSGDSPADRLYAAALLDPEALAENLSDAVAYENFLEPCGAGVNIEPADDLEGNRTVPTEARDVAPMWEFRVDDGAGSAIDLCNDNRGQPVPKPGLHNLQIIVSDREFFRPQLLDAQGEPRTEGGRALFGPRQCGVPDLAIGATYAVASYVFECIDAVAGDAAGACLCAEAG